MAKQIDYIQLGKEIFKVHNALRKNPQSFIEKLKESKKHFRDLVYHKPGEDPIQTYEGISAIDDEINFLKTQKPVPELQFSEDITNACRDQVKDRKE